MRVLRTAEEVTQALEGGSLSDVVIQGANLAGHAFASKYTGDGKVTLCFLGDGAVGIGPTHEGMTLAGLWDLPIVFVVENNRYSMGTPVERTLPVADITSRAPGYGLVGDRFAVTDPFQVRDRLGQAIKRAREQSQPTLVEVLTYRFRGHSMSDPAKYRGKGELEAFRANVAHVIDVWNAGGRGDESTCHAVACCVREVGE
jgi:pyruvate dehydrogenase E1 component alpha subunit